VRHKVEGSIGNPLLANLKQKRGVENAFISQAERFEGKRIDENATFLGPGYYDHQSNFEKKAGSAA